MLVLLYGCTSWTLMKHLEKKLDLNYTRTLLGILNKSWKQHHTKQLLCSHLPPISQSIQGRHDGQCLRNKDEFIDNILQWTSAHGHTSVDQPAKPYIHQFCVDTRCCLEDLLRAITNWDVLWVSS